MIQRLAYLFGEVQAGNNPVNWVRLNPQDKAKLSEHIDEGKYIWGAEVIEDPALRPGNCQIDKLGKRTLY